MQLIEKEFDKKNFKKIEIKSNSNLYFEKLFLEYSFEYISKYKKILVIEIIINDQIINILATPDIDGHDRKISFFDEPINFSFDDEEVCKKILDLFRTKYNTVKVKKICKNNILLNNLKNFQSDESKREIFEETEIDLTIELDQIFNKFSKGHKYNVKKKDDLNYQIIDKDNYVKETILEMQKLHELISMKKTRSNNSWLINEKMILEGKAFIIQVKHNKKLISSTFFFHNNYECIYFSSCTIRDYFKKYFISHKTIWLAIKYSKELNLNIFKLGRSKTLETRKKISQKEINIEKFKNSFGGNKVCYISYLFNS